MLKAGIKRRRTQRQITDKKAEEAVRQMAIEEKLAKFDELENKVKQAEQEAGNNKVAANILSEMINKGLAFVDENGNVEVRPQIIDQSQMSQDQQQQNLQQQQEDSQSF